MKKLHLILLTFASIASALSVAATTGNHLYLDVSAVCAIPGNDFETSPGLAIALGNSFAVNHKVELEGIAFNTELKSNTPPGFNTESDVRFMHLLATYRYTQPLSEKFKVFAGLSAGMTHLSYEITTTPANPTHITMVMAFYGYRAPAGTSFTGSDNVATGGPQLGFAYDVGPQSAITVSAKWLYIAETEITSSGGITLLQAGFQHRF